MRNLTSCYSLPFCGYTNTLKTLSKTIILSFCVLASGQLTGQIKIGDNPHIIDDGSLIEMESKDKALVIPRMTTAERDNIPTPLKGAIIFNLDENCLQVNIGTPAAPDWVCPNESQATGIINTVLGNRIGTYVNNEGFETDFFESVTEVNEVSDGVYVFTNELGETDTISTNETVTTMIQNADGSYSYINEEGVSTLINISETVTSLTDNLDGTFTFRNENGEAVSFSTNDVITTLVDNGDGTYTYRNEIGMLTVIDPQETTSMLVDNGNGTYTYTDEEGVQTIIAGDQVTTQIQNTIAGA